MRLTTRLPARPEAVREARALVTRMLEGAGVEQGRRFEALLVASELVTNAVEHGSRDGDEIGMDVTLDRALLQIAVRDAARGRSVPVALTRDERRPTGRGLAMVDWLAEWSERIVDGEREVSARLTL